jgi:iron complex transport system substrate-binding protein
MQGLMQRLKRRSLLALAAGLGLPAAAQTAAKPLRLISIGGAVTELVYELGAQNLLVGVDSTSLYPAVAQQLPNVGYARTLAAEGLLSLSPSLIVATEEAGPPAVLRQLEAARVPLHVLRAEHKFEGMIERTQRLGSLIGREVQAQVLVERLNSQWRSSQQTVQQLRQGHAAPKVLFVLSMGMNQIRIAGRDTAADAMLGYAGASNALQGVTGYKPLTPEAAIAAAPDLILATEQGLQVAGGIDGLLKVPGLALTPAGRARKVVSMEVMELLGFGPRLPQAVTRLAQALHA